MVEKKHYQTVSTGEVTGYELNEELEHFDVAIDCLMLKGWSPLGPPQIAGTSTGAYYVLQALTLDWAPKVEATTRESHPPGVR